MRARRVQASHPSPPPDQHQDVEPIVIVAGEERATKKQAAPTRRAADAEQDFADAIICGGDLDEEFEAIVMDEKDTQAFRELAEQLGADGNEDQEGTSGVADVAGEDGPSANLDEEMGGIDPVGLDCSAASAQGGGVAAGFAGAGEEAPRPRAYVLHGVAGVVASLCVACRCRTLCWRVAAQPLLELCMRHIVRLIESIWVRRESSSSPARLSVR